MIKRELGKFYIHEPMYISDISYFSYMYLINKQKNLFSTNYVLLMYLHDITFMNTLLSTVHADM